MFDPPGAQVNERTGRRVIRKKAGPPRPVEEPRVPDDLVMLAKRRESLTERLEKVRNSANLQLSQYSRDALDEAIDILTRLGWDQ